MFGWRREMIIKVKLYDTLKYEAKANLPHLGSGEVTLRAEATVNDLILKLGIEKAIIGLIIVNKRQSGFGNTLKDGDKVELFSPMAGG